MITYEQLINERWELGHKEIDDEETTIGDNRSSDTQAASPSDGVEV